MTSHYCTCMSTLLVPVSHFAVLTDSLTLHYTLHHPTPSLLELQQFLYVGGVFLTNCAKILRPDLGLAKYVVDRSDWQG